MVFTDFSGQGEKVDAIKIDINTKLQSYKLYFSLIEQSYASKGQVRLNSNKRAKKKPLSCHEPLRSVSSFSFNYQLEHYDLLIE